MCCWWAEHWDGVIFRSDELISLLKILHSVGVGRLRCCKERILLKLRVRVCSYYAGDCWLLAAIASLTLDQRILARVVPPDQTFAKDYAGTFTSRSSKTLLHLSTKNFYYNVVLYIFTK